MFSSTAALETSDCAVFFFSFFYVWGINCLCVGFVFDFQGWVFGLRGYGLGFEASRLRALFGFTVQGVEEEKGGLGFRVQGSGSLQFRDEHLGVQRESFIFIQFFAACVEGSGFATLGSDIQYSGIQNLAFQDSRFYIQRVSHFGQCHKTRASDWAICPSGR